MYKLLFRQFFKSTTIKVSLVLVVALGIVSILIGKQFLSKQEQTAEQISQYQEEGILRNVEYHKDDLGLLLYYLRFALINQPENLAGLSIGQSDINPNVQNVTILNLEGQKYDTDLINPVSLQSGNLDLGFVIICLFPLLIITLTYNLLSEETENGTWRLVAVQAKSKIAFLLAKFSVRVIAIYAALGLLFFIAKFVLSIPFNGAFLVFVLLSVLYIAFWFALSLLLVSLKQSSSFNILSLLSSWLVLVILLPAGLNNYMTNKYPVPEALSTIIKQRDGYHEKWDMEKRPTMERFYADYPQFKKYGFPKEGFTWLWYYAMQQMGDDEAKEDSDAMKSKILQREKTSQLIGWLIPTIHTQLTFNNIAGTSLGDHMNFLDATNQFHEKMRLYFYPKIFEKQDVQAENWNQFKPEYVAKKKEADWLNGLLPVVLITLLISAISMIRLQKI
ncbi:MAG: ABC transporter permease [Thalassobius sp.]|nr:ABC transporter permease [Thalassovita sp.]